MAPMSKRARQSAAGLPRLALVVSRYNATITDRLLAGAVRAYALAGGRPQDLYVAYAPGAFEVVSLSAVAGKSGLFEGVLAIGCIIKGETRHDEFLGHAVTTGLAQLSAETVPVGLAVLTVNTVRQAEERAGVGGGELGNKGEEAMLALLQTVGEARALRDPKAVEAVLASGAMIDRLGGGGARVVEGRMPPDKAARGKKKVGRSRSGR